jgi:hypothetical protein
MIYDPRVEIGQGYDIKENKPRSTPFIASKLTVAAAGSLEGQDGDIKVVIAKSAKELSDSLSAEASAFGSGWGFSAKLAFSMSS